MTATRRWRPRPAAVPPHRRRRLLQAALGASALLPAAGWAGGYGRRRARAAPILLPAGQLALVATSGLSLMAADGSLRQIAPPPASGWLQDPAWSPDGTQLAYTRMEWPQLRPASGEVPWPISAVYAVKPSDPDPTPVPLIQPLEPKEAFVSAAWAPDGAHLYAVRRRPAPGRAYSVLTDVLRVDLATGEREALDLDVSPSELAVSRDGALALIGAPKGVPVGTVPDALYLVTTDGAARLASADRAESDLQFLTLPRFSPDGRRLLFVAASPVASATLSAAPTGLTLPAAPAEPSTVTPPDGARSFARLASPKTAYAHGIPAAPWVADLDAGTIQPLVAGPFDDVAGLAWADKGRLALLLDASGLAQVTVSGDTSRLTSLQASGLAWHGA